MNGPELSRKKDALLAARAGDTAAAARSSGRPRFLGFLDLHEQQVCRGALKAMPRAGLLFWGGYSQAERTFLGVFPSGTEPQTQLFPLCAVRADAKGEGLDHRDYLGSLLSLGIERGRVGDLLTDADGCVLFLDAAIAPFVLQNLQKVGGTGVVCSLYHGPVERVDHFETRHATVASPRLDCIVAALTGASRDDAARLIERGSVNLNFMPAFSTTQRVSEESTVSIRGYGRFLIDTLGPPTKKGRLNLTAKKYS